MVEIKSVQKNSPAAVVGICPFDMLVSVNDNPINDVLDYGFYTAEKKLTVCVQRQDKKMFFSVEKEEYCDLGLEFETPLMDKKHSCRNKCIFCFIDQLPKGMRKSLYFKDDDSRLSFLHGNYVTLTNMDDEEIERIIKMRISPVNISVHTTNPELRVEMMKNKRAGEVLKYLDVLAEAHVGMRAQIVLCRGVNDGEELIRTMHDLAKYYPALDSVSIVPAGLTRYREGLYPLSPYTPEECSQIIDIVDSFAAECCNKFGTRLFFCADELYIKSGRQLPGEDYYEDYNQIENGIGLMASQTAEFIRELDFIDDYIEAVGGKDKIERRSVSLATGVAAYEYMCALVEKVKTVCYNVDCKVYKIENNFFGPEITVAGLLTGTDMAQQLAGKDLGDELLIPEVTLRADKDLFLCGMTPDELSKKLGVKVRAVPNDGAELLAAIFGLSAPPM
jgi:putative radical SAM enzyme (TIGR03279 family)